MLKYFKWLFSSEPTSPPSKGVLLGLDCVGKTTLLHKLKNGKMTSLTHAIGFSIEVFESPIWHLNSWSIGGKQSVRFPLLFPSPSHTNAGCDKYRPLYRHYVIDIDFMLFVVDLTDTDRFVEAMEELAGIARRMTPEKGPSRVFVLFSKQDLLGREEREKRVEEYKNRFLARMTAYFGDRLCVEVMDTPGLDIRSGKGLNDVMAHIKRVVSGQAGSGREQFVDGEKPVTVSAPLSHTQLMQRVRELSAVAEPDDYMFWRTFLTAKIHLWDHYAHLRAGYFILLEQLEKENDVFAAAEDFLEHLARLRTRRPDKFKNTAHRTMTTFWLIQLKRAGDVFAAGSCGQRITLKRGDFRTVMMQNPELINGGLWKDYYSRELMFSPEARSGWKEPDLRSLTGRALGEHAETLRKYEPEMSEKSTKH